MKTLATMFCIALLAGALAPRAGADAWNKKTIVTFNAPVEVPGKVLLPGTYVFKLLDSASNRNIVQIFNKDENQVIATILAIPDYRMQPTDKPLITFEERASGSPEAIKAWYYPGDNYGARFVYPHNRAVELAKRTNDNVLSMSNDMTQNITAPAKTANESSVQEMKNTEVRAVKPSGEEVELALVIVPVEAGGANGTAASNASQAPPQTHQPAQLPKTASDLPLISLIGGCALGFGLLARFFRRRTA